jgi:curved DNA-binding protein CbpA
MSEQDETKDYYSILGAAEDATQVEIERHYRRKAVQHHPDRGGSEEDMKSVNEAYGVLKDQALRRAYDNERQPLVKQDSETYPDVQARASRPVQLDAITHQALAALIFIVLGLVLLFIVRFQYVIFLWPLALLAVVMILVGIVQAHSALDAVRRQIKVARPALRLVLVQEALFWSFVFGGGYGVYLLLTTG